jgi:hypothetical protein
VNIRRGNTLLDQIVGQIFGISLPYCQRQGSLVSFGAGLNFLHQIVQENDMDPKVVAEGARFLDMAQSIYTWSRTQQTIGSLSAV